MYDESLIYEYGFTIVSGINDIIGDDRFYACMLYQNDWDCGYGFKDLKEALEWLKENRKEYPESHIDVVTDDSDFCLDVIE